MHCERWIGRYEYVYICGNVMTSQRCIIKVSAVFNLHNDPFLDDPHQISVAKHDMLSFGNTTRPVRHAPYHVSLQQLIISSSAKNERSVCQRQLSSLTSKVLFFLLSPTPLFILMVGKSPLHTLHCFIFL